MCSPRFSPRQEAVCRPQMPAAVFRTFGSAKTLEVRSNSHGISRVGIFSVARLPPLGPLPPVSPRHRYRLGNVPYLPFPRQREVLSSPAAGLQLGQLVQAPVPAPRLS